MSLVTWLLLCSVAVVSADRISALVGEGIKFPLTENCASRSAELVRWDAGGTKQNVASFNGSIWTPAAGYEDRMTPGTSAVLNRTFKNDEGKYETGCGEVLTELDVVQSQVVEVFEGAPATLPCFHITTRGTDESVLWERNLTLLFEMNLLSNQTKYGTGFDHRVDLSSAALQGNLSLTLQQTQLDDAGLYFCFIKNIHGKKPSSPDAVKLIVNKVNVSPNIGNDTDTTTTVKPENPPQHNHWKTATSVLVVVVCVLLILIVVLLWRLKKFEPCCQNHGRGQNRGSNDNERSDNNQRFEMQPLNRQEN